MLLRIAGAPLMIVYRWIDMTISDDQIQPSIIVEIDKARTPTKKRKRDLAKSGQESYIGKVSIAVIVTDGNSHPRLFTSVLVQSDARRVADLFKCSIALINVELFWS